MRLGASYNVFEDSIELLKPSIKNIRNEVDYINVIYQKISNHNNHSENDYWLWLDRLKEDGLIDNIIEYVPTIASDSNNSCHWNELQKRKIGKKDLELAECTHFISMDSDEFYDIDNFAQSKKYINLLSIDSTVCKIQDYHKSPIYQHIGLQNYNVPFIQSIHCNFAFAGKFYAYCDPTRIVDNYVTYHIFSETDLIMDHMTGVRLDIHKKINNSSAKINFFNKTDEILDRYLNISNCRVVEDSYNIINQIKEYCSFMEIK